MQVLKPFGDSFQVTPPFRNASAQEMRKDFEKAIVLGLSHPATPVKFPQKVPVGVSSAFLIPRISLLYKTPLPYPSVL